MDSGAVRAATSGCPFCAVPAAEIMVDDVLAFTIADRYPVSLGHALVIPRRHVADWWSLRDDERSAMTGLVIQLRRLLDSRHRPDGYNVGFNAGVAAGQTVAHAHVHVIPRYTGDVPDPRGGIRQVLPDASGYLTMSQP